MAESPALLDAYLSLSKIFATTSLSETERQIIAMSNNRLNGCTYCMAAHSVIAKKGGVPEDVIEALRTNQSIQDPKLEALRQFAIEINESRGWPKESSIEALLAVGYSRQTVLEVILGTAYKVLSNYTNHVASTETDAVFQTAAWSPNLAQD
ncbi:MAG: carboxymuconolactone decarboxylase family protein [Cohaesibacter sp.]|nr:carboxymuconolactone decarboxylase family protein [Cohaesibacter sp.]